MTASQSGVWNLQELTDLGALGVGFRLYTYAQGTTTQKIAYTDAAGSVAHTYTSDGAGGSYIALNARGELPAPLYLTAGSYDLALKRADGSTVWTRRADPIGDSSAAISTALAASTGATLIGWIRSAAGTIATTVAKWLGWQPMSAFDFMTDAQIADVQAGTALLDHTAAIQSFRDAYAASTKKPKAVFPAGRYKYSLSPNWAIQNAHIEMQGEVRFRYTGTGNALIFDADAADAVDPVSGLVYGMKFGWGNRVIVECPATALNAVYVRSIHHSKIGVKPLGAGTAYAGLKVNFAVCTEFDVVCSVNEEGWYATAKPAVGIDLDKRGANEQTSYCTFVNPIVEGPAIGIQLTNTLGNMFNGGTAEACSSYGLYATAGASGDRVNGMDFEANTTADVYNLGTGVEINNCDTSSPGVNFGSTATLSTIRGGRHKTILLDTGSAGCAAVDTIYNRSNNGGTFTDGGTGSTVRNVRNGGSNALYLTGSATYDPPNIPTGTAIQTTVTVTGAKIGDVASCSFTQSLLATSMSAAVTAADTVTVTIVNVSGAGVDLPSGTLKAVVTRGA